MVSPDTCVKDHHPRHEEMGLSAVACSFCLYFLYGPKTLQKTLHFATCNFGRRLLADVTTSFSQGGGGQRGDSSWRILLLMLLA
jgi:hypothetical protein